MVKYIPDISVGFICGKWEDNADADIDTSLKKFISETAEPEINQFCGRFNMTLDLNLKKYGYSTAVRVFPGFAYRSSWNAGKDIFELTFETVSGDPPKRRCKLDTQLKMSLVIAYITEGALKYLHEIISIAFFEALKDFETISFNIDNKDGFSEILHRSINDPNSSDYILYRCDHEKMPSNTAPVLHIQSDAFQCKRVPQAPDEDATISVSWSEKKDDNTEWLGIGTPLKAFDSVQARGKFILAKNESYQKSFLKGSPKESSWTNYWEDLNLRHGIKLYNLTCRLQESLMYDATVPGAVALSLNKSFETAKLSTNVIYSDRETKLKLISEEDRHNLNSVVFAVDHVFSQDGDPKQYYCLQKPIAASDLEKLLIASVGNVLVILGDYGSAEYNNFLYSKEVKALFAEYRYMVQYIFLCDPRNVVKVMEPNTYDPFISGNNTEVFLMNVGVDPKEAIILDFSKPDINFNDNSKNYLRTLLMGHSGNHELVERFIGQYGTESKSLSDIVAAFRSFRGEQLAVRLQHEINLIRRELGKMDSSDPARNGKISRLDYLTLAMRKTSGYASGYSAAKDWDEELTQLTGLNSVKTHIHELKSIIAARYARGAESFSAKNVFTFEGNPGCGKTMVARYFAYSLKQSGFVSSDDPFVDVKISSIVGQHIGEASKNVDELFENSAGSVIFIDEAYSLLDADQYGRSAINSIVKNISSMSPDTVLILAGYPSDISRLLKKNSGLESRVVRRIRFEDYSCAELLEILRNNLNTKCGLYYESSQADEIEKAVGEFLLRVSSCGEHCTGRTIGNARFIDNFVTRLELAHVETLSDEDLANRIDPSQLSKISDKEQLTERGAEKLALANKLRTVTLDMVKSAIAELDKEYEKTGSTIGSTRPTYYVPTTDKDTFERVIGNKNAKEALKKQIEIFRYPDKYKYAPEGTRGILLCGAPGCGKTMLARAVAHEAGADVAFMCASGTDFIKEYEGWGIAELGKLFDEVEAYEKCVLFIDEIDAIGMARGSRVNNDDLAHEALMKLLTCLDGFKRRKNFLIIAATNVPDSLDPALRRRLGTKVTVELPNPEERLQLLRLYLREFNSADSIPDDKLKFLADHATHGFSGDKISKCVTEAYFRSNGDPIELCTLENTIYDLSYGFNGNIRLNEADKKRTAYHESGHAVLAHSFGDPVLKATILPNDDGALGHILSAPSGADSHSMTKFDLENRICVLLGGRAAEELFSENKTPSFGCGGDLDSATNIAVDMAAKWGMGSTLRVRAHDDPDVLREADKIIGSCYEKAKDILSKHADIVHKFAAKLAEKEALTAEEISAVLGSSSGQ